MVNQLLVNVLLERILPWVKLHVVNVPKVTTVPLVVDLVAII